MNPAITVQIVSNLLSVCWNSIIELFLEFHSSSVQHSAGSVAKIDFISYGMGGSVIPLVGVAQSM